MIGGICESPLAIRSLLTWTEQVRDGVVPLRDVIDLDLTFVRLNGSPMKIIAPALLQPLAAVNDDHMDEVGDEEASLDDDEEDEDSQSRPARARVNLMM